MLDSKAAFENAFVGKGYVWHPAMDKLLGQTVTVTNKFGAGTFGLPKSDPSHSQATWYYPISAIACVSPPDPATIQTVQQPQVIATQPIALDFTLAKYYAYMMAYQNAFLQMSGANPYISTVSYSQVSISGGRRLSEGSSVAKWTLRFDEAEQATAAQAAVSSDKFAETVSKQSGVEVEPAKATIKVVEVRVAVTAKYEWKVSYPSCTRGYWASGCGQPRIEQKGTVKCYGSKTNPVSSWEAKDTDCAGKKPTATRICKRTKPCRKCSFMHRLSTNFLFRVCLSACLLFFARCL